MNDYLPSAKHFRHALAEAAHVVTESRTGSRYETSSFQGICTCGWKKIGKMGEVRKAANNHILEQSR